MIGITVNIQLNASLKFGILTGKKQLEMYMGGKIEERVSEMEREK